MKIPFKVDLSDQVVAITGGGGVLMGAFAEALAACGAKVGVIDIDSAACDRVAGEIEKAGGRIDYVEALDASTLEPPTEKSADLLVALAVYFGKTRLIDNTLVWVKR